MKRQNGVAREKKDKFGNPHHCDLRLALVPFRKWKEFQLCLEVYPLCVTVPFVCAWSPVHEDFLALLKN